VCQDYQVLALDQRGRGDSDWARDGDYSTGAYVADLAALSDTLKLNSFVLVGHSMGGRNSMSFAARYPEKVQKLVVVDVGPVIDPVGGERLRQEILTVPEEFDSFEAVVEYMARENRYASDRVLRRRLQYATKELPNGKIGWRYDLAIREERRRGATPPSAEDVWSPLRNITSPTLIVRGLDTDLLSTEVAAQMLDTIPNCQLTEVERAGHMVFEDNPDGFLEAVRSFL
jgi:pimeloyl-ACP methyl ester carboxylesterase